MRPRFSVSNSQNGGERKMPNVTDQLIAIVLFGLSTFILPTIFNKWSDSRAGVR
jgi:hypothetical protein